MPPVDTSFERKKVVILIPMGCLKLRYYQPEPTLKVVYGKTEPQQKGVQSWLSVDPLADERSWVSPYSYVQNSPVMRVDPSGALDTKYVDEEGNTILETNDGSDDVVIVPENKIDDFKYYAESYEDLKYEYDSKGFNNSMKAEILDFETTDEMQSCLSNTSSKWSRNALIKYLQEPTSENWLGFLAVELGSQWLNPLNHIPSPIKVKGPKPRINPKLSKTNSNFKAWNSFRKEMGKGKFTKEIYGTSEAAKKARSKAFNEWKNENGY